MDIWERFNETLPNKKVFYSELYLEDITEKDYMHAQNIHSKKCNSYFKKKNTESK